MKKIAIILLFISFQSIEVYSQCMQSHPNSLFSVSKFLSFLGSMEEGEELLLAWDFCFKGTSKSKGGQVTYYDYRIDHTLNRNTGNYYFDYFMITNEVSNFTYMTNSNENFLAYKNKLINYGFRKLSDDIYSKTINGKTYTMSIERTVHYSGTPNYKIHMAIL
ncbi:MAG: hypothetical protein GC192_15265 [Bacteroidetes bacterium]|nr:hypothetical protein [Bacteroidota bacterium]